MNTLPGSPTGPLWREFPISRAFFYISLEHFFICLSKSPVNEPPSRVWTGPLWTEMPVSRAILYLRVPSQGTSPPGSPTGPLLTEFRVSRAFFYASLAFPNKSSDRKISPFSRSPWEKAMFPKTGPLWKKALVSRALFIISFRISSEGTLPPSSPYRAPIQIGTPFPEPCFICLSKSKRAPLQVPQRGHYGERCPFPEPSFTCPSGSPVKEPPPSGSPNGAPIERYGQFP